jgi:hypothetical protein
VSLSCRQDNKLVTVQKDRAAARAATKVKAQGIFMEVLTGFETFAERSAPRRSFLPFCEYRVATPPVTSMRFMFLSGETYRWIEVHAMS